MSLSSGSLGLMAGPSWLNKWWPSRRLLSDPLHGLCVQERYAPVSISNWKLIPPVARDLLAQRVPQSLSFSAQRRLTVIVPYRDRAHHLQQLAPALIAMLERQRLNYRVLVVEQLPGQLFNRGRLLNVGMHYAAGFSDYYCLHDVDALPVVANYACPSQPLRLVTQLVTGNGAGRQRTCHYFSGAVSIRKDQAFAANGFSNEYWGWGKEDDDFYFRLLLAGYLCYYDLQGTYFNLPNPAHQQVPRGRRPHYVYVNRERRSRLLRRLMTPAQDGLANLHYRVIEERQEQGYQRIQVRW